MVRKEHSTHYLMSRRLYESIVNADGINYLTDSNGNRGKRGNRHKPKSLSNAALCDYVTRTFGLITPCRRVSISDD